MGPLYIDHVYYDRRNDWRTGNLVEKMRLNWVRLGHILSLLHSKHVMRSTLDTILKANFETLQFKSSDF